jgi:hypothetical protein
MIPSDFDSEGSGDGDPAIQLGELMMILELHRQGLSITAIAAVPAAIRRRYANTSRAARTAGLRSTPSWPTVVGFLKWRRGDNPLLAGCSPCL